MFKRSCVVLCSVFAFASVLAADLLESVFVKTPENGGNDANSGESWELAKATIGEALNAVAAKGTVTVGPGTYVVTAAGGKVGTDPGLAVASGVKLVSSEGPEKTIITPDPATATDASTVLNIGDAGTMVSGFAISDGRACGVYFSAAGAVLTNCIVRNMLSKTTNNKNIYGIYLKSAGTVSHCVISNNMASISGGTTKTGVGVSMEQAGTVTDCLIADNRMSGIGTLSGDTTAGAGVSMTAGTLRNCLIVGNSDDSKYGAAVKITKGTIQNCTIAGNITSAAASSGGLWITSTGAKTLINTIVYGNLSSGAYANWKNDGTGTLTATYNNADPAFSKTDGNISVDPAFAADWTLGASDCVDGGFNQDWMVGAKDIAGNDRIVNERVDMGCYEKTAGALETSFTYSPDKGLFAPVAVTFTAKTMGVDLSGLSYKWEFNNPAVEDAEGPEFASVTRTLPADTYAVKLTVTNASGATADYSGSLQVGPKVAYVSKTGAHEFPYDTEAKAATNLIAALAAAVDGTRVEVAPGTYGHAEPIRVDKAVWMRGADPATTVLDAGGRSCTTLEVANDGAFVEGFTITGSKERGLTMSSTCVVSNCIIRGNGGTTVGAGVYFVAPGTLVDCEVSGNHVSVGGFASNGCAIHCSANGPLIDSCRIFGNSSEKGNCYGSVYFALGGTIRNTLVVGNTQVPNTSYATGCAGVYATGGGSVVMENCTIMDNATSAEIVGVGFYASNPLTIRNTIVWGNRTPSRVSDCGFIQHVLRNRPELNP